MTILRGIEVPEHFNGVGLHDTPGSETATWGYDQSTAHARELRAHGVTLYKLFGSGTKGERARAYRDNGIVVLHRWWPGGAHWGKRPEEWLMPWAYYNYLLSQGVSLFEPGWNEFNIADEWVTSIPNAAGIADAVLDAWEIAGARYGNYNHMLFPSNTPGGHVDHRACYNAIAEEIAARGLQSTIKHVAIHPRPLNNPPGVTWTATNTCTFDEWRWIRDKFKSVGVNAYYWATEHGYSLDYNQNAEYPPINLSTWEQYNWDLFARMNPAHQAAIEPELAGTMYWFNAGWGHWGAWAKDALVDSTDPAMPAPSPLWARMGNEAYVLEFSRYEGEPVPPPSRARGFMASKNQITLNWPLIAEDYDYVVLRVSGPNDWPEYTGLEMDPWLDRHVRGAESVGLPKGGFHFLVSDIDRQADFFAMTAFNYAWELPLWCDVEAPNLDHDRVQRFLEGAERQLALYEVDYPELGVYTNLDKWNRFGPWDYPLWLAQWDVEEPSITGWKFWQYGGGAIPDNEYTSLDCYVGTAEELRAEFGIPENGGGTAEMIDIVDRNGNPVVVDGKTWNWESVQTDYGLSLVEAEVPEGEVAYRLKRLVYDDSGETNWRLYVLDENGAPLAGIAPFLGIQPPSGEDLPPDMAPQVSPGVFSQPAGKPNRALILSPNNLNFTSVDGFIQHSLGSGSNYVPPGPATHWAWVTGLCTDTVLGIGMWENHRMFWPVFQRQIEGDDENGGGEEPGDGDLAEVAEAINRNTIEVRRLADATVAMLEWFKRP